MKKTVIESILASFCAKSVFKKSDLRGYTGHEHVDETDLINTIEFLDRKNILKLSKYGFLPLCFYVFYRQLAGDGISRFYRRPELQVNGRPLYRPGGFLDCTDRL